MGHIEAEVSYLLVFKCFHSGFLQRWQGIYPDARVVKYNNAGHYLFEDVPQDINDEIEKFMREDI